MIGQQFKTFLEYLRSPARRTADEFGEAIEEELAFHIAERTREHVAEGVPEDEAKRLALQRFGDASRVAAECHAASIGGLVLWHRLHLVMTAALTVAVAILAFQGLGLRNETWMKLTQLPPGIASMLDNDWTGDVTGRILDERQRPIANANVMVVVKTWPDQSYFQRAYAAISNADGRFHIDNVHPVNERYEVQIAAVADRRALTSSYHSQSAGELEPIVLELRRSSGVVLQVESPQGTTLAGVEVLPQGRVDADGSRHLVYFDSAQSLVRRTDIACRVELPFFNPGDNAQVLVRTSGEEWEPRDIIVPPAGEVVTIRVLKNPKVQSEES